MGRRSQHIDTSIYVNRNLLNKTPGKLCFQNIQYSPGRFQLKQTSSGYNKIIPISENCTRQITGESQLAQLELTQKDFYLQLLISNQVLISNHVTVFILVV